MNRYFRGLSWPLQCVAISQAVGQLLYRMYSPQVSLLWVKIKEPNTATALGVSGYLPGDVT